MDKKEPSQHKNTPTPKMWGPISSILLTFYIYITSLLTVVFLLPRPSSKQLTQFLLIAFTNALAILLLAWIIRIRSVTFKDLGLRKLKPNDLTEAIIGFFIYIGLYIFVAIAAKIIFPGLDFEQNQQLGFETTREFSQLFMVFVGLVVVPPVVEEIIFRGFLYEGLRSKWPKITSMLIASVVFAVLHLQFGSGAPLLWVAAIDTFALSIVLTHLKEKTGSLGAPIILHAIKNGVAFALLFIVGVV